MILHYEFTLYLLFYLYAQEYISFYIYISQCGYNKGHKALISLSVHWIASYSRLTYFTLSDGLSKNVR